ncbi:MAG: hypothetical protein IKD20_06960 [Clostridia bacterium]|nr:hypothetical protein [Clostridia bacterium]
MTLKDFSTKYCLHDSYIEKINITDSKIIMEVDQLFCNSNTSLENRISKNQKIEILIEGLELGSEYEHIYTVHFQKNVRKDLPFDKFLALVEKYKMRIYLDFYSQWAQAMHIKGTIDKFEIEITISEVKDISLTS